jgi:hypothetical protein
MIGRSHAASTFSRNAKLVGVAGRHVLAGEARLRRRGACSESHEARVEELAMAAHVAQHAELALQQVRAAAHHADHHEGLVLQAEADGLGFLDGDFHFGTRGFR